MRFADAKDIKRAQELGMHSGATRSTRTEIARGKASAMAQAIRDKRKILGRLEAIANEWTDNSILLPFMNQCLLLWPNSIYTEAYGRGKKQGEYIRRMRQSWNSAEYLDISKEALYQKGKITLESGKTITGYEYDKWDPVAIIIFNAIFKYTANL
jgi:hypothetical protein